MIDVLYFGRIERCEEFVNITGANFGAEDAVANGVRVQHL